MIEVAPCQVGPLARLSLAARRTTIAPMSTDLEAAWDDLHDATPPGWFVGRPFYHERHRVWEQYAYDPSERAEVGVRSREWTAAVASELEVLRELARCLRVIREGRVPE